MMSPVSNIPLMQEAFFPLNEKNVFSEEQLHVLLDLATAL